MKSVEAWVDRTARRFGLQISRASSHYHRLPVEATSEDAELIAALRPFTMTSGERLWSLINAVRYVVDTRIPGDLVECGVWRGGSVMAMAHQLVRMGVTDRHIWLYDTFAGMTEPTTHDVETATGMTASDMLANTARTEGNNVWCIADEADVRRNIASTGYPMDNFTLVVGDVVQTLPKTSPESIALLRLDTDWYESTRVSLEHLYPRLSLGGVCILDDYGHWKGARHAVDEYFAARGLRPYMHAIDFSGRVFLKTSPDG